MSSKCRRCGLPFSELDAPMAHKNCDEDFETWLSPEELAEKAERIRQYKNKNQSGVKPNVKKQFP